jgi:hypothetical protein
LIPWGNVALSPIATPVKLRMAYNLSDIPQHYQRQRLRREDFLTETNGGFFARSNPRARDHNSEPVHGTFGTSRPELLSAWIFNWHACSPS